MSGVAGEVPGHVQDAVAKSLGFVYLVLAVEREQLRPDHHVVGSKREFQPRGVGGEGVERQVAGARLLERLDPVLDLGVLAVHEFQGRDVLAVLIGDEALEAVAVEVGKGQLRPGVWPLAAADQSGAFLRALDKRVRPDVATLVESGARAGQGAVLGVARRARAVDDRR